MSNEETFVELARAVRVADQLCSSYCTLRDRLASRAQFLDVTILLFSVWLSAMTFAGKETISRLTPLGLPDDLWLPILSVTIFGLSLIQLQVNWKGRAQLYQQSSASMTAFVKEARAVISERRAESVRPMLDRYQIATDANHPIPESEFLKLKKKHLLKVAFSKHLDKNPGASWPVWRIAIFISSNRAQVNKDGLQ